MTRTGEVICGRYEMGLVIEMHGMAQIRQAYDRMRDRLVRVKCIATTSARARALLAREALLMTLLEPRTSGTLAYHDLAEHAGGLFLITEHVRGVRLPEWEKQDPSPRRIARMYAHLAQVLHEIHAADVVHRDVKPSFVMILTGDDPARYAPGSAARLKLVSLELAVLATEPDTLTGGFVGTPRYMSPEMVRDQHATSASDVFALGCMLVEALTGKPPWRLAHVMDSMQRLSVPPDLHGLAGSALGDLASAMLALSPEARPPAAEIARVLSSFADA